MKCKDVKDLKKDKTPYGNHHKGKSSDQRAMDRALKTQVPSKTLLSLQVQSNRVDHKRSKTCKHKSARDLEPLNPGTITVLTQGSKTKLWDMKGRLNKAGRQYIVEHCQGKNVPRNKTFLRPKPKPKPTHRRSRPHRETWHAPVLKTLSSSPSSQRCLKSWRGCAGMHYTCTSIVVGFTGSYRTPHRSTGSTSLAIIQASTVIHYAFIPHLAFILITYHQHWKYTLHPITVCSRTVQMTFLQLISLVHNESSLI